MNRAIIIVFLLVFVDGLIKKAPLFDLYKDGVKEALTLIKPLFITIFTFMIFVSFLRSSGFVDILSYVLQPILTFLKIPVDILVLGILRPVSGSASLSFLYTIYEFFGIDHPLSLLSTLIQSGSDTTLYVVALYFSSIKMSNTKYAIPIGLTMDFLCFVFAIIIYMNLFV